MSEESFTNLDLTQLANQGKQETNDSESENVVSQPPLGAAMDKNKQQWGLIMTEIRALEEDYRTAMGEIRDLTALLELQTSELKSSIQSTSQQLEEQQKINQEIEEQRKTLAAQLEEKSKVCEQLLQEQAKYNQEMLEYLENCRKARNELKHEKTKVESISNQWRFYRNSHKQSEKMKKAIAEEIDNFFDNNGEKTLDQISKFVKQIKRQIGYEEESFDDENVPHNHK